jgi:deoxyuridine 5'-triphosphate nucleotidohydrolase
MKIQWTGQNDCRPRRFWQTDAGFDLRVARDITLPYRKPVDVPCGLSIALPETHWGRITGRSSTFRRLGVLVIEGIIDSGFRGELFCTAVNLEEGSVVLSRGDRIAQLILHEHVGEPVTWEQVEALEVFANQRGHDSFGSTGR